MTDKTLVLLGDLRFVEWEGGYSPPDVLVGGTSLVSLMVDMFDANVINDERGFCVLEVPYGTVRITVERVGDAS